MMASRARPDRARPDPARAGLARPVRPRGFTLLEILVVLVIIGVSLALVQLNLTPGENSLLNDEFARLDAALTAAQDEVAAGARPLAFELTEGGYHFLYRDADGKWVEETEVPLGPHLFPPGVRWGERRIDGLPVTPDNDRLLWLPGQPPTTAAFEIRTQTLGRTLSIDVLGRVKEYVASEAH